jgi:hypothetical protein
VAFEELVLIDVAPALDPGRAGREITLPLQRSPAAIRVSDYASSSAAFSLVKPSAFERVEGLERWRATGCSFRKGSARRSSLNLTGRKTSVA